MPWGRYKGVEIVKILELDPDYMLGTYLNNEIYFEDELIEEMINRRIL